MEFKAELNYEYQDFLLWNKVYARTSKRILNLITKILLIIVIVLLVTSTVLLIIGGGMDFSMALCEIVLAAGVIILLFRHRMSARISQKMYLKDVGTEYVSFGEEDIAYRNAKQEGRYFYSGITAVYYGQERFFILLDKRHAIILPKASILEGDPEAFGAFISGKTGHEVKNIKC